MLISLTITLLDAEISSFIRREIEKEYGVSYAMTELLKFFEIQGVDEIALVDQVSEANFNEKQWADICNSILQSVRSKSNE